MRALVMIAAAGMITAGLGASAAAESMKPGLWEVTMKSDDTRQMPKTPPEQIEQMRKMGIEVPTVRDGALVHRMCITKEMAARNQTPDVGRHQGECKLKSHDRSGNNYRAEIACDGPNLKGTGVMKGTFASNTSYTSTYDFKGTSRGQPLTQHHDTAGKWLGADCGNVRPLGEMHGAPAK